MVVRAIGEWIPGCGVEAVPPDFQGGLEAPVARPAPVEASSPKGDYLDLIPMKDPSTGEVHYYPRPKPLTPSPAVPASPGATPLKCRRPRLLAWSR